MKRCLAPFFALALAACDRFEPHALSDAEVHAKADDEARAAARAAMTEVVKAALAVSSSCVAGELLWEADPDGNPIPRHHSRPCLPERCSPKPEEIEALKKASRAVKSLVEGQPTLRVPSFQGFSALSDAMVAFADTALAGSAKEKDKPARLSGLSMHYGALAAAHREMFKDSAFPAEPPTLTASLAAPGAGGDVCKGWAMPKYCDVTAVRVPKEHKWRASPPCVEVEAVKR